MALVMTANAQLTWGVKAGLNVSSFSGFKGISETDDDCSLSTEQSGKAGFHVGVDVQYMFSPQIGIESGLFYSTLGSKITGTVKSESDLEIVEFSFNPSYLQLPISVLYKFNVGQDLYIYPSLGLYAGYGLSGKITINDTDTYGGETHKDKEEWNLFKKTKYEDGEEEAAPANRFDMGLTVGLTLQYSKFTFGIGYERGFSELNKEEEFGGDFFEGKMKNQNFKVSIGYFF